MRQMKDSGIPWIGEIPSDWAVSRIERHFSERSVKVSDKNYPPLSVTKQGILPQLDSAAKTNAHDDRKLVCIGDFVINSRSDRKQSCGLSSFEGSVSLINTVIINKDYHKNYLRYLFDNYGFAEEYYRWGTGIVDDLWSTNYSRMKKIPIPVPPQNTQVLIGTYLDQKVSLIDNIIEKIKQSIEEYKKLKQSIITEAVTKGLNPDVKMKDSGIEWIGMIPEHWEVKKISNLLSQQIEKNTTSDNYIGLENIESWSGRYLEKNEKTTDGGETLSYSLDCILFGKLRPYLAKVYLPSVNGCCSSEFSVLNVVEGYKKYLYYFLISVKFIDFVNSTTYGVKMPRANWLMISKTKIATPSFSEQVEIANILDVEIGRIDNVLNSKEVIISELESYKKSLIYEVVTGKKEIA
jgi:type I restriction enzyme, S subunit